MGLFKKKKEEKRINKAVVIIIELFVAIVLFLCAIGIKWLLTNKYNPRIVKLEEQTVEGVTFSDFVADYSDVTGKIKVNAINYTENDIVIKGVTLNLYAKDNTLISRIELPNTITLKPNEKYLITNDISTEVRIGKVEYEIGK